MAFPRSRVRLACLVLLSASIAIAGACSDANSPATSAASFRFTFALPGQAEVTARGDSAYWTVVPLTPTFSAFFSSNDSLAPAPPPVNFSLVTLNPVLQNGRLPTGTYYFPQTAGGGYSFSLSSVGGLNAGTDSGSVSITRSGADSSLTGVIDAWMHQYQPTVGAAFHLTGSFTVPRAD